jgi:hypothetical protein
MIENMNNKDKIDFEMFRASTELRNVIDCLHAEGLHELAEIARDINGRTDELSAMLDRAHGINAALRYLSGRRIYA